MTILFVLLVLMTCACVCPSRCSLFVAPVVERRWGGRERTEA